MSALEDVLYALSFSTEKGIGFEHKSATFYTEKKLSEAISKDLQEDI